MKNTLIIIIFLFSLKGLFSKEIPEIAIPAPNVFEITKFGNVTINESTGRVVANIPIGISV